MPAWPGHFDYEEPDEHEPIGSVQVTPDLLKAVRVVCDYLYSKRTSLPDNVHTQAMKLDAWRFEFLAPAYFEDAQKAKEPDYSDPPY